MRKTVNRRAAVGLVLPRGVKISGRVVDPAAGLLSELIATVEHLQSVTRHLQRVITERPRTILDDDEE